MTFKAQPRTHQSLEFKGFSWTLDFPIQHDLRYLGHLGRVCSSPSFSLINEGKNNYFSCVCMYAKLRYTCMSSVSISNTILVVLTWQVAWKWIINIKYVNCGPKINILKVLNVEKHSFHYSVFLGGKIGKKEVFLSVFKKALNTPNQPNLEQMI